MKWMQRSIVALLVAGALSLGLAGPAAAQLQDGLVNVTVTVKNNEVTILENVGVGVAAQVVAQICNIKVGPLNVLGSSVDAGTLEDFTCTADTADAPTVTIIQNE